MHPVWVMNTARICIQKTVSKPLNRNIFYSRCCCRAIMPSGEKSNLQFSHAHLGLGILAFNCHHQVPYTDFRSLVNLPQRPAAVLLGNKTWHRRRGRPFPLQGWLLATEMHAVQHFWRYVGIPPGLPSRLSVFPWWKHDRFHQSSKRSPSSVNHQCSKRENALFRESDQSVSWLSRRCCRLCFFS